MKLYSTGGTSLDAQQVECDCGAKRSLSGVTEYSPNRDSTFLSDSLDQSGQIYMCRGSMPWNGDLDGVGCDRKLSASLRAASNLYYAAVKSSIYLPRETEAVPESLIQILVNQPVSVMITTLMDAGVLPENIDASNIRSAFPDILTGYGDSQISGALRLLSPTDNGENPAQGSEFQPPVSYEEIEFRRAEYEVLTGELTTPYLQIKRGRLGDYESIVPSIFEELMLIEKLRETRVFCGFNRVFPTGESSLSDRISMLWKNEPDDPRERWLPAYAVHGEGVFLTVDSKRLAEWSARPQVQNRATRLSDRYDELLETRPLPPKEITAQFVLLHTLSHTLMNRLTFECGYSSAALRERIYTATGDRPMAGILIYTAAGDAEGTMGGLVRMGKPGYFEAALMASLQDARWCSADPVCMELGESGQGPDSLNMAACHNCTLVPETACEEFNRFLDRGLLVGTRSETGLGFAELV
jgi:hypothetical protein